MRRSRQFGRVLLGAQGTGPAALGWTALLVLAAAAVLLANAVLVLALLALTAAAVAMARSGLRPHWSHWSMLASAAVGVVSLAFVWWVVGVRIDAADHGTPEPPAADWDWAGLVGLLLAAVGFVASAVVAVLTHSRLPRPVPTPEDGEPASAQAGQR